MKKLTAFILALAAALTLAACAPAPEPSDEPAPTPAATPTPEPTVNAGDTVRLGGLDWLVLTVDDGRALILSVNVLENRPYHTLHADTTWEHCGLREFLNGEFYDGTFTDGEKSRIAETALTNGDNPEYGTAGGGGTTDRIFLLSIDEFNAYMGDGAHINIADARAADSSATGEAAAWWLRSPGFLPLYAAIVYTDGLLYFGGDYVSGGHAGVRPALWLTL